MDCSPHSDARIDPRAPGLSGTFREKVTPKNGHLKKLKTLDFSACFKSRIPLKVTTNVPGGSIRHDLDISIIHPEI